MAKSKEWVCDGVPKDGKDYPDCSGPHEPYENTGPDCIICGLPREAIEPKKEKSKLGVLPLAGLAILLLIFGGGVYWFGFPDPSEKAITTNSEKTGNQDGTAIATARPTREGIAHEGSVISLAIDRQGEYLVSGSADQTIKIWDLNQNELLHTLKDHGGRINDIAIDSEQKIVVSGSGDGTTRIWSLETGEPLNSPFPSPNGRVLSVAIAENGQTIASATNEGQIHLWDVQTGELKDTLQKGDDTTIINSLAVSPNNNQILASGRQDGTIQIWDLSTGNETAVSPLEDNSDRVFQVAISADGERLVSGTYDEKVRIWNLETGELERKLEFNGHDFVVSGVTFSADGETVASAGFDEQVMVWNANTGRRLAGLRGHSGFVHTVAFSSDQSTVVSGGFDGTIRIWDWEQQQETDRLEDQSIASQ